MVRKIQAGKRRPGITFPILYKSVSFAKKRPHLPKIGNKGGFNSSFYSAWLLFFLGTFRPGKKDYLSKCSELSRKFYLNDTKLIFLLFSNRIFWKLFVSGKQPGSPWQAYWASEASCARTRERAVKPVFNPARSP